MTHILAKAQRIMEVKCGKFSLWELCLKRFANKTTGKRGLVATARHTFH